MGLPRTLSTRLNDRRDADADFGSNCARPRPGRRDWPVRDALRLLYERTARREIGRLNLRIPSWVGGDARTRTEAHPSLRT